MNRYQKQHKALGTTVFITLVTENNEEKADKILRQIINKIDDFDNQFSRFKETSELTKFNSYPGQKTKVSEDFLDLIKVSQKLGLATKGIFNPLVLPSLQKSGYMGSWTKDVKKATKNTDYSNREDADVADIELGEDWAMIPVNSAIDFGGIGKGYLLDKLRLDLDRKDTVGYWISLGGDIICSGYDIDNQDWSVNIASATDETKSVGTVKNSKGKVLAIATSGTTKRRGTLNGREWHHIIDPRTGRPAESDILTCTVTASSGVKADIYAKCILIEGSALSHKYIEDGLVKSICLQLSDGSIRNI